MVCLIGAATGAAWAGGDSNESDFLQVMYDLTGVAYMGGPPSPIANLTIEDGSHVMRIRWEDVVLETHTNGGVPNWGSEAYFGIRGLNSLGEDVTALAQPFPYGFGEGTFGPVDGSLDLEMADLFAHNDGTVAMLVGSSWDDGSGEPAGTYLGGTFIVDYLPIPAPAVGVLLALAGLRRSRSRA